MQTGVAVILFNRPDLTEQVFRAVAAARPRRLFLIADGPRPDHAEDSARCARARAVVEQVDWECDVRRNYSDVNLGCGLRPATGISWVFEHVDAAIILEDDCVPHPTFFPYCEELLERFRDDPRVMLIAGHNPYTFAPSVSRAHSYRFSRMVDTWGWATWARAWMHHDMGVERWPERRRQMLLQEVSDHPCFLAELTAALDAASAKNGNVDYWDYQWAFALWAQAGLAVAPTVNLVSNRGFRDDATHTRDPDDRYANSTVSPMECPLRHPPFTVCDVEADRYAMEQHYARTRPTTHRRLRNFARKARALYDAARSGSC